MPDPVRKKITKKKGGGVKSDVWWLRKKVPERYRDIVGRREVWRSLKETNFKTAVVECNKLSLDLDKEWEDRLRAAQTQRDVLPADTLHLPGDQVWLTFKRYHLFEKETGLRLRSHDGALAHP